MILVSKTKIKQYIYNAHSLWHMKKIRFACLAIPVPSILYTSIPSTFNLVYIFFPEDPCELDFTPYLLPWEFFFPL